MRPSLPRRLLLAATILSAGGCATPAKFSAPDVPASLRPPAAETLFLEAHASGVQIYECAPRSDRPASYEWTFRAPEATLVDASGQPLGRHFAGPTWESRDGSSVVGEVKARDPGPSATAIPWLLLSAKATKGSGIFSATTSVQRVQTVGGVAPAQGCDASNASKTARVPYTANYYFYRAPH
jgi:Protein of unknown function (DUF3455)